MQVAGSGQRISAAKLRRAMQERPTLHFALLKFYQAFSNGLAKLDERLARWILMSHDRIDGNVLPLTHQFLAIMLGVRRAGVTVALQRLEGLGFIRLGRGEHGSRRLEITCWGVVRRRGERVTETSRTTRRQHGPSFQVESR
jgi:hypothetical protein